MYKKLILMIVALTLITLIGCDNSDEMRIETITAINEAVKMEDWLVADEVFQEGKEYLTEDEIAQLEPLLLEKITIINAIDSNKNNIEEALSTGNWLSALSSLANLADAGIDQEWYNNKKLDIETGFKAEQFTSNNNSAVAAAARMKLIEGGSFMMGSTSDMSNSDEAPVHEVVISPFWLSEVEVTFELYDMFTNSTDWRTRPDSGFGRGQRPIINVSWYNVTEFCNWLSIQAGLTPCYSGDDEDRVCDLSANGYRLPTEAEWEFAAQGGVFNEKFYFSGSNTLADVAWYETNSDGQTHPVASKNANILGIYDLTGNVWEWCNDWTGQYPSEKVTDPSGPNHDGDQHQFYNGKIIRGGSWYNKSEDNRITNRSYDTPTSHLNFVGFRLARTIN